MEGGTTGIEVEPPADMADRDRTTNLSGPTARPIMWRPDDDRVFSKFATTIPRGMQAVPVQTFASERRPDSASRLEDARVARIERLGDEAISLTRPGLFPGRSIGQLAPDKSSNNKFNYNNEEKYNDLNIYEYSMICEIVDHLVERIQRGDCWGFPSDVRSVCPQR
jgi:hypothetical protein